MTGLPEGAPQTPRGLASCPPSSVPGGLRPSCPRPAHPRCTPLLTFHSRKAWKAPGAASHTHTRAHTHTCTYRARIASVPQPRAGHQAGPQSTFAEKEKVDTRAAWAQPHTLMRVQPRTHTSTRLPYTHVFSLTHTSTPLPRAHACSASHTHTSTLLPHARVFSLAHTLLPHAQARSALHAHKHTAPRANACAALHAHTSTLLPPCCLPNLPLLIRPLCARQSPGSGSSEASAGQQA